jgi:hypothetical protein
MEESAQTSSTSLVDKPQRLSPQELAEAGFVRAQKAMAVRLGKIKRGEEVREQ